MTAQEAEELAAGPLAYFPHDADAAGDLKVRKLLRAHGYEGYGRWWRICELMAAERGHRLPVGADDDLAVLAEALGFGTGGGFDELMAADDCRAFIDDLVRIGLLARTEDGAAVYSQRMMANASVTGARRAAGRKGGRPRKGSETEPDG